MRIKNLKNRIGMKLLSYLTKKWYGLEYRSYKPGEARGGKNEK